MKVNESAIAGLLTGIQNARTTYGRLASRVRNNGTRANGDGKLAVNGKRMALSDRILLEEGATKAERDAVALCRAVEVLAAQGYALTVAALTVQAAEAPATVKAAAPAAQRKAA